jgi:4-oxalocrotonate tautomerase
MPVVTVLCRPHSLPERQALVAGITAAVVGAYSVEPGCVQVFVVEADDEHWARGGQLGGPPEGPEHGAASAAGPLGEFHPDPA